MAVSPQTKTRMTAEEYKALPETKQHVELIHGELIVHQYGDENMPGGPKDAHQQSISLIQAFLYQLVPAREVRAANTDVYLDNENIVQPDVLWASSESGQCVRQDDGYLHGAPDLVIEVLSPTTARHDRSTKFNLYEKNGVREYWMMDADIQLIEVYVREGDRFTRLGGFGPGESFTSPVLGNKTVNIDAILGQ